MTIPESPFEEQFQRLLQVTGSATQTELAAFLGVRQSTVSEQRKHRRIPSSWLKRLARLGVNTRWVITGEGQPLLGSNKKSLAVKARSGPSLETILHRVLMSFPTPMLQKEIAKRLAGGREAGKRDHGQETPDDAG